VMALINPHPALKVAAPMSPMVDVGWEMIGFISGRIDKQI